MSNKKIIVYAVEYREDNGISYFIQEGYWKAQLMYYTKLVINKDGYTYQGMMDLRQRGFVNLETAKIQLRGMLYKRLDNDKFKSDLHRLPIIKEYEQTTLNFEENGYE